MKNLLKYGVLAIAAIATMSCAKELDSNVEAGKKVQLLIPAETVTKTSFNDDMKLQWNAKDTVGIFIGETTKNAKATLTRVEGKAYFTATVTEYAAGDKLYAYYPYDAANDSKTFSTVTLSVKNSQTQNEAAVFNGTNNPMVAVPVTLPEVGTALSESLKFRHIASIVQFDIFDASGVHAGETVKMVQFSTNGLATANNGVTYDLSKVTEDGELTTVSGNANYRTVTVSLKSASADASDPVSTVGTAAGSSLVYMMIVPGTYTGSFYVTTDKGIYRYADRNLTVSAAEMPRYTVDLAKGNSSNEILTSTDYECFVAAANAGDYSAWKNEDGQVKLGADITAAHEFTRIQTDWDGIFNGQNHSIKQPESTVPLFTKILADAKVCNLVLEGSCNSMSNAGSIGSAPLALTNYGTIENVTSKVNVSVTNCDLAGAGYSGMVRCNAGLMKSCTYEGNITLSYKISGNRVVYVGGIADFASDNDDPTKSTAAGSFINCTNKGNLTVTTERKSTTKCSLGKFAMGGICAIVHMGTADNFSTFEGCINEGTISGTDKDNKGTNGSSVMGGIIGRISTFPTAIAITIDKDGYYAEVKNCTNNGTIENGSFTTQGAITGNGQTGARTVNAGGIIGYASGLTAKAALISNCTNTGTVKGGYCAGANLGGICGLTRNVQIEGCTVDATLTESSTPDHKYGCAAGVVGVSLAALTVKNCFVNIVTDFSTAPEVNIGTLHGWIKNGTATYDNIKVCGTLKYGDTNTVITAENVAEAALLGPTALKATNITYWTK